MCAIIGIDDRRFRIVAHAARAQQMVGKVLFGGRRSTFLYRICRINQFHDAAVNERKVARGFFPRCLAKGRRLQRRMIRALVSHEDGYFVVGEIRLGEVRASLQDHDAKTVREEFLGHYTRPLRRCQ